MNKLLLAKELTPETAKFLIDSGANINYKNENNRTPLYMACFNDNFELVKFLIENGADKEYACYTTTEEIKKYLVEVGCPAPKELIKKYGTEEQKSNFSSSFRGACESYENTKLYIEKGGDINKQDNSRWTLLHYAVHDYNLEWVKYLVDKGANQKIKDIRGRVPARFRTSNFAIYDILKDNINEPDNDGNTILHNSHDIITRVRYLINLGARWDIKNNNGKTAYDLYEDKNIFKTKEEKLKEFVGADVKWAIQVLLKEI